MAKTPREEQNQYPDVVNCYKENCYFFRKSDDGVCDGNPFRCINDNMAGRIIKADSCPFRKKFASVDNGKDDLKTPSKREIELYLEENDVRSLKEVEL